MYQGLLGSTKLFLGN